VDHAFASAEFDGDDVRTIVDVGNRMASFEAGTPA
jgi:hypothetical protein